MSAARRSATIAIPAVAGQPPGTYVIVPRVEDHQSSAPEAASPAAEHVTASATFTALRPFAEEEHHGGGRHGEEDRRDHEVRHAPLHEGGHSTPST
jgi:hypothetical protein